MSKLKEIIIDIMEDESIQDLSHDTKLRDDLGFDSLRLAQLTVMIEDEFDVDIFEDGNVETIGEILKKINDD